jgi:hypothetical protein
LLAATVGLPRRRAGGDEREAPRSFPAFDAEQSLDVHTLDEQVDRTFGPRTRAGDVGRSVLAWPRQYWLPSDCTA